MKKRRGKRLVAYIIAFAMIFSMGMTELSPIAEAAQYTILETDVSAPSTGCTMFGVYGTYYVDAQNALNRINEIRKEACEAGNVPDPRNSNRMLTASDYVPIKWSTDLERIARIRAVEGGLCFGFVGSGHNRLNGKGLSTVKYNGVSTYAEVLAYNWNKGNLVSGINQWYDEKSDWVKQTSDAVTGHYTSMIDPRNTYVGLGDFYTTASGYPNTLAGEFNSTSQSLSQSALSGHTDIMQKVEVKDAYINKYYLKGEATQYLGETQKLTPMVHLVNGSKTLDLWVIDTVTYTSSDTTVASVTADGVVTAKKAGTTTITCKKGSTVLCTFSLTVSCNHNKVLQSTVQPTCQTTGENIYKCSKCGMTIKETIEKAPHSYVYGTADSTGKATGVCSFCNATITIVPPTSMLLCWRNSESSDSYYHLSVPTENSVGSNILCYVKDVNGDSGYRDVMFESSDDSIVEAPKKSIVQPNDAVLKVKKAGIVTISVYPKYNPAIKKSYTIRTGADGSVDISNAVVTLAKTSISCGTSTSAVAPTVTYNGIKLTSGTDYTVSHSTSGTTGTCKITGKGIFSKSVEKTYTITHTYVNDPTVTGALKSNATCTKKATYYKSCSNCKKLSTETFESGSLAAHSYTVQHVDTAHFASAATCEKPAAYYYSCAGCGQKGTTTFYSGDKLNHQYTQKVQTEAALKEPANCVSPAIYYYSCARCGAVDKSANAKTYTYGTAGDHSYTKKIISDTYLASAANCSSSARYYYACSGCNKKGDVQYSYGKALGHAYSVKHISDAYMASAATCTSPATYYYECSRCGKTGTDVFTYGDKLPHQFTAKIVSNTTKKSDATYDSPAVYYYSCSQCGAVSGSSTFTYGTTVPRPTVIPQVDVSYKTHIQTYGDSQPAMSNGWMAGTSGEAKRLENIWVRVSGNANLGVQYTTHCQTYGWLPWSANGEKNGTSGEAKRLEAIKIRLTGADKDNYDIYYRVHAQSFGWLAWAKNGEPSGTAGYGKRLEGIQIVVVKKGESAPGQSYANVNPSSVNTRAYVALQNGSIQIPGDAYNANIMYKTHVQSFGWQTWKTNGQMSGTSGKAKRLEGINIKLSNASYSGGVRYTTHVQSYGWQGNENDPNTWKKDGEMSGTSGQAKRLEAIRISLYGEMAEHYDIYYRVHAQSFGWLSWAKNGEASGTAGLAKRLEGIQIILVPKGSPEPGRTYDNITATNTVSFIRR
ncbi:MAG: Ig-like domain-containing protein [Lachnospiraceae bacterium]|nr:Ig-like domain-containing protein [Lachnospiraceae bacterium]